MKEDENNANRSGVLEQQLYTYYSLYIADSEWKSSLRKQLIGRATQHSEKKPVERTWRSFLDLRRRPGLKWASGFLLLVLICLFLLTIRPVRAAIEHTLGIGYLEGVGFVKVNETGILAGPIYSIQAGQTIIIDRVVSDPKKIRIWLHSTGTKWNPEFTNGEFNATLEVNNQRVPVNEWSWQSGQQTGVLEFRSPGTTIPKKFLLHLSTDWSIPIGLIPMDQASESQSMTMYPDICQAHSGVEVCLKAFVSDPTGYHLWLSAFSENPNFYLSTLEIHNPLTGEAAALTDSSGHPLTQISSSPLPLPMEVAPVGSLNLPQEVTATLSFERSKNDNGSLDLLFAGLTGKTSINETILCELGKNPQIGDRFPCEKSINIAGELIRFHDGEITQNPDGIHLTLRSDPIQPSKGLLLTGVDAESLNNEPASLLGTGFFASTKQLEIWLGVDSLNGESKFAIRITAADLTILEPFQLSWTLNP